MTIYLCYLLQEIYTGRLPFHQYHSDWVVLQAVLLRGEVPERPSDSARISDRLWTFCNRFWDKDPMARLTSTEALEFALRRELMEVCSFSQALVARCSRLTREPGRKLQRALYPGGRRSLVGSVSSHLGTK